MIYVQLLVLCFSFIIIWLILTNFRENQNKESMRTIPRPNPDYDPNEYVTIKDNPTKVQKININEEIDNMIKLYFGRNNIPTKLCIATYYQYFVNQGNVSIQNKMRLKDFCYYILQYVIPSIPSELNPNPSIDWPFIEFLSNSLKSYTVRSAKTYSPFVMYEIKMYDKDGDGNINNGSNFNLSGAKQPGIEAGFNVGSSNSSDSNSKNNNNGNGSGSSCGCPTACFSNLLQNLQSANNKTGSSDSSGIALDVSSNGTERAAISINTPGGYTSNNFLADPSLFSNTNNDVASDLKITNEPQTVNPGTLDTNINDFIDNYFGIDEESGIGKPLDDMPIPSQLLPTKFGKVEFTEFFKTRSLIDQRHKTKLYDLVYYFMENIIVGLPTETVPFSYVEWRPIVWSSVSYV
jgi:hypothetical protein